MAINAYLNFGGNCREAVDFYTDVFGVPKKDIMTYAQAGAEMPVADKDRDLIMHTELDIDGSTVMMSDVTEDWHFQTGNNISLVLTLEDTVAIDRIFEKLAVGGHVVMPLQQTFWSQRYGFVTDRFGIGWQLSSAV